MGKIIRGFNNSVDRRSKEARELNKRYACGDENVKYVTDLAVEANMTFEKVSLVINNEGVKPVRELRFDDGKITSIKGNLPYDVEMVRFTKEDAPQISVVWKLNNKELIKLVEKGALGSDYDADPTGPFGKPKTPSEIPNLFTEVEWEGIPIKVDVMAMASSNVPVVAIEVPNQFDLETNSRISGYEDLAQYFKKPEEYEAGQKTSKSEMFVNLENETLIGYEKPEIEETVEDIRENVIESEPGLTPEELEERKRRDSMRMQIAALTAQRLDEAQVDATIDAAEDVDVPETEESDYFKLDADDSAEFSESELIDMGLVDDPTKAADKAAAEEKIREMKMKQQATITEVTQRGEGMIDQDDSHRGQGPNYE